MIRVFIGTEANQRLAERVLEYSIRLNARQPVSIRAIHQTQKRVGGTNFGFVRFTIPSLCQFQGKAIYLDADQLVFEDISQLVNQLDEVHQVAVVTAPVGTFGGKPVAQHAQTSVMVMNCEKVKWNPNVIFSNVVRNDQTLKDGEIHYRDFMCLRWLNPEVIQSLPPEWNHFNHIDENTKLVHFSYVRNQPWKNPKHALTPVWADWLKRAMNDGFVTRGELIKEVWRRHVHPSFLKLLFTTKRPQKEKAIGNPEPVAG